MKFAAFKEVYEAAVKQLRYFEGDQNWPGLAKFDRVYALPTDWQNEEFTAIVRAAIACRQSHAANPVVVEIVHWHWRETKTDVKAEFLNADQLRALANIKENVRRWIAGHIDDLPPSTCRHLKVPE